MTRILCSSLVITIAFISGCDYFFDSNSTAAGNPPLTEHQAQQSAVIENISENKKEDCKPREQKIIPKDINEKANEEFEKIWGIRVESLILTMGGHMLDFRYRVLDTDKALPLLDSESEAYIIDEKTGNKYIVPSPPKAGSLRQTTSEPEEGRIYYIIFANPGKVLKSQSMVTVVIGSCQMKHLTIQ